MILKKENRRLTFMSLFLASALIAGFHTNTLRAQDDLSDADEVLNGDSLQMDDINLEGKLSPSEKLRQRREKLEERNKVMVEKKIEDMKPTGYVVVTDRVILPLRTLESSQDKHPFDAGPSS